LSLLRFIHDQFSAKEIVNSSQLIKIFKLNYPDKIYYLDAEPMVLMQRLIAREDASKSSKNMEVHETLDALTRMSSVYNQILEDASADIERIDANSFEKLDMEFEKLRKEYL
jgi:thymidylate kinase